MKIAWSKIVAILFLSGVILNAVAQDAEPPPEQADAYVALVQADLARDSGKWDKALEGYQQASQIYQSMAQNFPQWQPDIVQYRLTYCANQIKTIARKLKQLEEMKGADLAPSTSSSASAVPAVTAASAAGGVLAAAKKEQPKDTVDYKQKYMALLQENQYLHKRVEEIQEQVPSEDIKASAKEDVEQLKAENAKLLEQLKSANASAGELLEARKAKEEVDRKAALVEQMMLKQELLQKERDSLASERDDLALKVDEFNVQVGELQARVVELEKASSSAAAVVEKVQPAGGSKVEEVVSSIPVASLMQSALAAEKINDFETSLKNYDQVLVVYSNNLEALKGKGRSLLGANKGREAIDVLKQASTMSSTDGQVALLLGAAYFKMGQYEQASEFLAGAAERDPSSATAQNVLGAVWMAAGKLDKAIQHLEAATNIDPTLSDAYYNLAQAYFFNKPSNPAKALESYNKAIHLGAAPDEELAKLLVVK